jgi:glycosyltransferase involved in cell wall biosynthesis
MAADVTVAIPVYNGARFLEEVLSAVRGQATTAEVEILIVDSGSRDGSRAIAARHGATLHTIDKADFSHGGTRNRMVELAQGEVVCFLTQDATPAGDGWLAAMLEGFQQAADVALVFGPHRARADASHMIRAEMERHFATWGDGGRAVDVQRLPADGAGLRAYRRFPGRWTFFSDVNGAVAKWAWRQVPYKEVPYAEDQLLGREMIEAGFAKVFHPGAAVVHSHDYPPLAFARRYFDEYRSLREVLGHVEPFGWPQTPLTIYGMTRGDARWLRAHGVHGPALARGAAISARHYALRMVGSAAGSRADRFPAAVRRRLSLEGRASFEPYEIAASPLLARRPHEPGAAPVREGPLDFEFARRGYPRRPVRTEPRPGGGAGPWTLAWIVPPWEVGSGGHTTIFRLIRQLEERGHRNVIHVFDFAGSLRKRAAALRREIRESFVEIDAEVFVGLEDFSGADACVATGWQTAFAARDLPGCREKVYLVQDIEPEFYATSAQFLWAEETYKMGYRCVAYTPWMAGILRERYACEARWFECGTDLDTFAYAGEAGRVPGLVAVYARQETERRAVDLAFAALATAAERRADVFPVLFGSRKAFSLPFEAENLGVVAPRRLAELYRRSSVGLVFSLTTHSLVAQEMMASGLPVVELEGDNVGSALGRSGDLVVLADRTPDAIADAIRHLLDDRTEAAAMAARARAFVETRTWERAGGQVEDAIRSFLEHPREA